MARLDGTGISDSSTGIPFLHHMLDVSNLFFFLDLVSCYCEILCPLSNYLVGLCS